MIPRPAVDHYRRMQRLQIASGQLAGRAWRTVDPDRISETWANAIPELSDSVSSVQVRAATLGSSYTANTLAAQGLYTAPDVWVNPAAFGGWSSRGAPLESALYSVAPQVKQLLGRGHSLESAMRSGERMAHMLARTQVADAGRTAAGVDTFARRGVLYTRMLNPPSCSRCAILAGRLYRNNEGFLRHPNCDCVHVATSTSAAEREGLVSDPYEYFESLSEAEQDRIYTKAGAQAIRDGGDMFQVVNSRRGMKYAGESSDGTRRGQRVRVGTSEGTSRRGHFYSISGGSKRLTPDDIYRRNLPRDQTLELLRNQGYVLPQGQNSEGVIRGRGSALGSPDSLTAAEQRVQRARLQWEAAQRGKNPFGKGPVTPEVMATAENNYRRWLLSGGQIYTR